MSNVVKFPSRDETPPAPDAQAPRRPQLEDGYTRINNDLLEALISAPVTDRERRVAFAVVRLTYGWNRTKARATAGLLAEITGIHIDNVGGALVSLLERGIIKRHGGSRSPVSLNKALEEWNIEPRERKVPTPKKSRPESGQVDPTESGQVDPPSKDRKDSKSSPYGEESTAGADAATQGDQEHPEKPQAAKPSKADRLPNCPHQAILDQWAEIMPEKRQPLRSLWAKGNGGARDLAARWKQGFGIINEQTGEPLYTDEASGIDWWGRFFKFLRRSEFLMRDDSRFFGLDWVAKADNFRKIMELKYHGDLAQGDGGEA